MQQRQHRRKAQSTGCRNLATRRFMAKWLVDHLGQCPKGDRNRTDQQSCDGAMTVTS